MMKDPLLSRLLKKAQMQGGAPGTHPAGWVQARGVLGPYAAAPRERANAADGPFSAAYYAARKGCTARRARRRRCRTMFRPRSSWFSRNFCSTWPSERGRSAAGATSAKGVTS